MEKIRTFVSAVCAVAMIGAIVGALVPKNSSGKISIMCVGIIMMAVIISPIKNVGKNIFSDYTEDIEYELSKKLENTAEENQKIYDNIIEERIEAYILQRSKEENIVCEVSVVCKNGEVTLARIVGETAEDIKKASQIATSECGILKTEERINDGKKASA